MVICLLGNKAKNGDGKPALARVRRPEYTSKAAVLCLPTLSSEVAARGLKGDVMNSPVSVYSRMKFSDSEECFAGRMQGCAQHCARYQTQDSGMQ